MEVRKMFFMDCHLAGRISLSVVSAESKRMPIQRSKFGWRLRLKGNKILPNISYIVTRKEAPTFLTGNILLDLYVVNNIRCWFSAIDIIRAINDEADQLVSVTHDFKFETPDEKKCAVDALCMIANAKNDVHLKHLKHWTQTYRLLHEF